MAIVLQVVIKYSLKDGKTLFINSLGELVVSVCNQRCGEISVTVTKL